MPFPEGDVRTGVEQLKECNVIFGATQKWAAEMPTAGTYF
jgi:hypothetical protein